MIVVLLLLASHVVCADEKALKNTVVYELHKTFAHDAKCFTQGLLFHNGYLYESCGLFGHSHLKKMDGETGEVLIRYNDFPRTVFSEGIVIVGNDLYMLTWQSKDMYVFAADTLTLKFQTKFQTYRGQGWGIVFDGTQFIASDGSNRLTYMTVPYSEKELSTSIKEVKVKERKGMHLTQHSNGLVDNINELELVGGKLYANLWYKDVIVIINPKTGEIETKIDMSLLYPKRTRDRTADCLNGIAYNKEKGQFLLTGKLWPTYYWVHFQERMVSKGKRKRRKLKRKKENEDSEGEVQGEEEGENSTSRDLLDNDTNTPSTLMSHHGSDGNAGTHGGGGDSKSFRPRRGRFHPLTNHSHHPPASTIDTESSNDDIGASSVEGNLAWVPGVLIATTIGITLMCVLLKLLVWVHDVNYDYSPVPSFQSLDIQDILEREGGGGDGKELKRIDGVERGGRGEIGDTGEKAGSSPESKELPYGTHRRTSAGNGAEVFS